MAMAMAMVNRASKKLRFIRFPSVPFRLKRPRHTSIVSFPYEIFFRICFIIDNLLNEKKRNIVWFHTFESDWKSGIFLSYVS